MCIRDRYMPGLTYLQNSGGLPVERLYPRDHDEISARDASALEPRMVMSHFVAEGRRASIVPASRDVRREPFVCRFDRKGACVRRLMDLE